MSTPNIDNLVMPLSWGGESDKATTESNAERAAARAELAAMKGEIAAARAYVKELEIVYWHLRHATIPPHGATIRTEELRAAYDAARKANK